MGLEKCWMLKGDLRSFVKTLIILLDGVYTPKTGCRFGDARSPDRMNLRATCITRAAAKSYTSR
jgi:hypothetical protein